ncbi:vacuolar protein sorting-associated protein 26c [Anaeramoeba flamelloides]|uniref:Vacuolar protein sorting-associated protein 26c n=1 Tax=Anaeramoeba flamelloides TaxID=1746091 RepID=A0AAV7ZGI0_9EUKA|nr:vacuolar protein sorting-associated protein 26c [Anaeramoeba flamelloides]KAJ3447981.1 vacuolar protein sorting-associated protein 26c [Anaeramoeba flamelloides]KAJ6243409.1 vacuolar protein sorting-associated protein 26c [Anaeramoeba flamelloides]KAJ6243474.1 vacuolar protein sorting-associated protein 26c [Anaeramoeba flamelloides]
MEHIAIRLKRWNKTYRLGETVYGVCVVNIPKPISHNGIRLSVEGSVALRSSAKNVGVFDSLYNTIEPLKILSINYPLLKPGKFPQGKTEIPFEFPFQPLVESKLIETYHGVYVNIAYTMTIVLARKGLSKNFEAKEEIYATVPPKKTFSLVAKDFMITPDSLKNVSKKMISKVPNFSISGKIDSLVCPISEPFTGHIKVDKSSSLIGSIEVQLIRIESCGSKKDGFVRETTEIQNLQIVDGNVSNELEIPIYVTFPKLFCCPSLLTKNYRIEFEINILVLFTNNAVVSENFPIQVIRTN